MRAQIVACLSVSVLARQPLLPPRPRGSCLGLRCNYVRSVGAEQRAVEKKAQVADAPVADAVGRTSSADAEAQAPSSAAAATTAPEVSGAGAAAGVPQQGDPSAEAGVASASGAMGLEPVVGEPPAGRRHESVAEVHEQDESAATQPSDVVPLTTPRGSHLEALSDDDDESAAQPPATLDVSGAGSAARDEATCASGHSATATSAAGGDCALDSSESAKSKTTDTDDRDEGRESAHMDEGEQADEEAPTELTMSKEEILMQIQVFLSFPPAVLPSRVCFLRVYDVARTRSPSE